MFKSKTNAAADAKTNLPPPPLIAPGFILSRFWPVVTSHPATAAAAAAADGASLQKLT
jgi:hypothetical protein